MFTFLAVLAFVPRVAGTGAHDADAAAPALRVDALRGGHVALGALPAAEAQAAALGVLPVAAAQHGAGCWGTGHDMSMVHGPAGLSERQRGRDWGASSPLPPARWLPGPALLPWLRDTGLRKNNKTRIPLEQSGPRNPGKQWQVPDTHSPFPWQFRGHSTTDSEGERKEACLWGRLPLAQGEQRLFGNFSCT